MTGGSPRQERHGIALAHPGTKSLSRNGRDVYVCVCIYVYVCIYIYIYIYIHIEIHVYIYIYIYIHIHNYTHITDTRIHKPLYYASQDDDVANATQRRMHTILYHIISYYIILYYII